MKQIKHRRRKLRIGNPVGFSLFCLGCLAVLALLYVGIAWLGRHGSTVAQAVKNAVQSMTGKMVSKVNVSIAGIDIKPEGEK